MTEVQSSPAPKKHNLHEFSNTHFHLLIVADDQDVNKALLERAKLAGPVSTVLVDLSPIRDTSGRARGIAVDKLLAGAAKAHPDSELIVATSAPAAFAGAMVKGEDNSFARGALQNIIDGLLGYRTLNLLDSIMVYAGALKKSHWFSSAMPAWSKLQHPKAEPKPTSNVRLRHASITPRGDGKLELNSVVERIGTAAVKSLEAKQGVEAKLGGKLAGVKGSQVITNPWLAFGFNEGPADDRNQHVAFDSLFDHHAKARMGIDVLTLDEIVETARLITSLEGSAAPHEISNKQTLARLIGAVRRSLASERYAEQLSDLLFALKAEQAGGNDIRKQIMMVVETGAIKYVAVANRRPLLATVFDGLHRRVKGALRRRKQVADQKKAQAEPAPVVEAPAKKKKKRKKKVKQASTEQRIESRSAAKILDTDQPALSEQEYQDRKQQLAGAEPHPLDELVAPGRDVAEELAQAEEK